MAGSGQGGAIDRPDVLAIARLARLRLSDEEVTLFTRQLNDILAHAEEIAGAVPDGAGDREPPRAGAPELRLRAGEAGPDPLLAGPADFAPEFRAGLFAVPRLEAMDGEHLP